MVRWEEVYPSNWINLYDRQYLSNNAENGSIMTSIDRKEVIQRKVETLLMEMGKALDSKSLGQETERLLSSEEEEKLATNILFTMSTYFIQLTQLCMGQMKPEDIQAIEGRLTANKENIYKLFNKREQSRRKNSVNSPQAGNKLENLSQIIEMVKVNKPKHPVSSFFFFFKQKSKEIASTTGEKVGSKIAKLVADIWKNMPERQKEPFEVLAQQTRSKYDKDMEKFKIDYADQIAHLKKIRKEQKKQKREVQSRVTSAVVKKEERNVEDRHSDSDVLSDSLGQCDDETASGHQHQDSIKRVATKLENKPKAPISSFFIYYKENSKKLSEIHQIPQGKRLIRRASEIWNNLTELEKQPYNEIAERNRRRYYEEMSKFKVEYASELRQLKRHKKQLKKMKAHESA